MKKCLWGSQPIWVQKVIHIAAFRCDLALRHLVHCADLRVQQAQVKCLIRLSEWLFCNHYFSSLGMPCALLCPTSAGKTDIRSIWFSILMLHCSLLHAVMVKDLLCPQSRVDLYNGVYQNAGYVDYLLTGYWMHGKVPGSPCSFNKTLGWLARGCQIRDDVRYADYNIAWSLWML